MSDNCSTSAGMAFVMTALKLASALDEVPDVLLDVESRETRDAALRFAARACDVARRSECPCCDRWGR